MLPVNSEFLAFSGPGGRGRGGRRMESCTIVKLHTAQQLSSCVYLGPRSGVELLQSFAHAPNDTDMGPIALKPAAVQSQQYER